MAASGSLRLPVLVASLAAVVAVLAVPCERPPTPQECAAMDVICLPFSPKQCTDIRGTFIQNGGRCGYCNACVRFEGEGRRCNTTEGNPAVGGLALESVCRSPLVCSARSGGVCVHPRQCQF